MMLDQIVTAIQPHGAVAERETDCRVEPAPEAGVFPETFYATTHLPTQVRINGQWVDVAAIEMDLGIRLDPTRIPPPPFP